MREWLKDALGISKWALVWDFEHCGVRLSGRHDGRFIGGMSKRFAAKMARKMNTAYGTEGHWIERA
jgi:hypothetical protein